MRKERIKCLNPECQRLTASYTGYCPTCVLGKPRQCAKCATPIRWYMTLCLRCRRELNPLPPIEGQRWKRRLLECKNKERTPQS